MTLDELHDAIVAQIVAAFPAFVTVDFYPDDESEQIATPACMLEMTEAEPIPENNAGTGQWPALARFEARIIMSSRAGATSKREVRKAAVAFATWINLRRLTGIATDPCQVIACEPDEFAPHVDRFVTWRVEWVMPAMFGESVWKNDGAIPQAFFSFAPDIGVPNEPKYVELPTA